MSTRPSPKNLAAVLMGQRRQQSMTKAERSALGRAAAAARWGTKKKTKKGVDKPALA